MAQPPNIQRLLRSFRVIQPADDARFLLQALRTARENQRFQQERADFAVPPLYLCFDAYNTTDYRYYSQSGHNIANYFGNIISEYVAYDAINVLEWGCGPGRIIRHMPLVLGSKARTITGADYNQSTIKWCRKNIASVNFTQNALNPPLPFEDGQFDAVYCLSVLTHLSEEVGLCWAQELQRITRPGGIIIVTTKSESFFSALLPFEQQQFRNGEMVVRGNVQEGKKMYSTFHSPEYVRTKLFPQFEILRHEAPERLHIHQDVWVLRKPYQ